MHFSKFFKRISYETIDFFLVIIYLLYYLIDNGLNSVQPIEPIEPQLEGLASSIFRLGFKTLVTPMNYHQKISGLDDIIDK